MVSDNIEIVNNDEGDEVIEALFESLLTRHQNILEKLMKGSDFFFDYIH